MPADLDLSPAPLHRQLPKIGQKPTIKIRRETMSEQDKSNGSDPIREMTRRTTLTLAAAVATFGAAMGMRDENDRACIFLNQQGCSVHPDRPLACRLYPLARWVDPEGNESFGHLTPHPNTEGIYGNSATVADYLDQQGVAPFFAMGDRYGAVYRRMVDVLENLDADELERRPNRRWP
jgi:Fe-S-cluster containining protein